MPPDTPTRSSVKTLISSSRVKISVLSSYDQPIKARKLNTASDRKSTRLNSSHTVNSYAVFCLTKKIACELYDRGLVMSMFVVSYVYHELGDRTQYANKVAKGK